MKKILFIAVLGVFILFATGLTSFAGVWQDKPVMCGDEQEVFGLMGSKNEQLLLRGDLIAKVRDPDEQNGIAVNPAVLPWAIYGNLETGTFTVLEYHAYPYEQFCTIGFGVEFELVPQALEDAIEWQRQRNGMK